MIEHGSEQHKAWVSYFAHKGWRLWFMEQLNHGRVDRAMVPTEWPEAFDDRYAA